jgi:RecA-family ATPase
MLVGKPKGGKSTLARDLALQVARGGSWLGFPCLKQAVIYVALEDRRADVRRHFRAMGATGDEALRFVFREVAGDLVTRLRAVADADRPGLIIVDTVQRAIKARDLNDYAEVTTKLTPILTLARETGAAVLLLHHAGKTLRADPLDGAELEHEEALVGTSVCATRYLRPSGAQWSWLALGNW